MIASALVGLAFALACGGEPSVESPSPVTVEVYRVEPEIFRDWVDLVGQLESESSVVVKPEISGVIAAIEFTEGQTVEAGEVLVRLRSDEQQAALNEATAKNELAREVLRRTRKLAQQNVSAAAELDRARAEFAVSKAVVEIAHVELARTEIRAPFDGVVGARLVAPGERVNQDSGIVQVDKVDRLQLVSAIPEIGVGVASVGLNVQVRVAPYPGEVFEGEVFFVAPTLNPRTRQLAFKAWLPNPTRKLKPGLFANLRVQIAEREDTLLVPESAIVYDQQGTFVWRVDDEARAERVSVELGVRVDGRAEIASGLQAGDRVISSGTHKVFPGAKLKLNASHTTGGSTEGDAT